MATTGKLSSLTLKIIAIVTMLIDHTAVTLYLCGVLPYGEFYGALRQIGRLAFPIFCFLIVEGAIHTHSKWKYLLRLCVLALISEPVFDLCLFRSTVWDGGMYQNVFFTLALGLSCIYVLQALKKYPWRFFIYLAVVAVAAYMAENVIRCDYGCGGIYTIAMIGLLADPLTILRKYFPYENYLRAIIVALAMMVCSFFCGIMELLGIISAVLIFFYNGQKGYSNKVVQYGFYFFYPVHLLILGLIFIVPTM